MNGICKFSFHLQRCAVLVFVVVFVALIMCSASRERHRPQACGADDNNNNDDDVDDDVPQCGCSCLKRVLCLLHTYENLLHFSFLPPLNSCAGVAAQNSVVLSCAKTANIIN